MVKPDEYYENSREELLPFIPVIKDAAILDIGCGAGGLGRLLKENGCGKLVGIELVAEQAARASSIYDTVYCENVENFAIPFTPETFDVIICADVLEHVIDPWSLLKKLRNLLKPSGTVVGSIPNVRHAAVIGRILQGRFGYDAKGILDRDHLRFFTFDDLVRLFFEQKLKIVNLSAQSSEDAEATVTEWKRHGVPVKLQEIIKWFCNADYEFRDDELSDFLTVQFLFAAVRID